MFLWFQSWSVKHDYANSDTTILSELETADTSRLAIH